MTLPLLQVRGLTVEIVGVNPRAVIHAVDMDVGQGELVAVVGESGSGKTVTLHAILDLLPKGLHRTSGSVTVRSPDDRRDDQRRERSRAQLGLVMQDPLTALDPVMRVGPQIVEGARAARGLGRKDARDLALELLHRVAMDDPRAQFRAYPRELSGGQRQRVMIAAALAVDPAVLLCDEPTTALDVTIQHQIMTLLAGLCETMNIGILLVTHDIGLAARWSNRALVMYGGTIVESGQTESVLRTPRHPYTATLVGALPGAELAEESGTLPHASPGAEGDADVLSGCSFRSCCRFRVARCSVGPPFAVSGRADAAHMSSCIRLNEGVSVDDR